MSFHYTHFMLWLLLSFGRVSWLESIPFPLLVFLHISFFHLYMGQCRHSVCQNMWKPKQHRHFHCKVMLCQMPISYTHWTRYFCLYLLDLVSVEHVHVHATKVGTRKINVHKPINIISLVINNWRTTHSSRSNNIDVIFIAR